jgi:hypothetical protein
MQPGQCLNCDTAFSDGQRFCTQCGQKTSTHRLTWRHFQHEFLHALTHADTGILHLFKELVLRPGVVAREYVEGKRKKYFNPFSYFLISAGVIVLVDQLFGQQVAEAAPDPAVLARLTTEAARANYIELVHRSSQIAHFAASHGNLFAIAAIPILALVWWAFYRRRGYNYVEFLTAAMLIDSVTNVLLPFVMQPFRANADPSVAQWVLRATLVVQISYLAYGLTGFLQLNSLKARLGGALVAALSSLTWMIVSYSVLGAYLFRNRQFYQFPLRILRGLVAL